MSEDNPGNSIFRVGKSADGAPGGAFIFQSPDGLEMFRVSDKGIDYNGESVKDAGRLHGLMIAFFTRALPPEVKALVEIAEAADESICLLCKALNPQHEACDNCDDHADRAAALAALKVNP